MSCLDAEGFVARADLAHSASPVNPGGSQRFDGDKLSSLRENNTSVLLASLARLPFSPFVAITADRGTKQPKTARRGQQLAVPSRNSRIAYVPPRGGCILCVPRKTPDVSTFLASRLF